MALTITDFSIFNKFQFNLLKSIFYTEYGGIGYLESGGIDIIMDLWDHPFVQRYLSLDTPNHESHKRHSFSKQKFNNHTRPKDKGIKIYDLEEDQIRSPQHYPFSESQSNLFSGENKNSQINNSHQEQHLPRNPLMNCGQKMHPIDQAYFLTLIKKNEINAKNVVENSEICYVLRIMLENLLRVEGINRRLIGELLIMPAISKDFTLREFNSTKLWKLLFQTHSPGAIQDLYNHDFFNFIPEGGISAVENEMKKIGLHSRPKNVRSPHGDGVALENLKQVGRLFGKGFEALKQMTNASPAQAPNKAAPHLIIPSQNKFG